MADVAKKGNRGTRVSSKAVTVAQADDANAAIDTFRVRNTRMVDEVTEHLRNLILDHRLVPGTILLQTEWAERLGVSRTPLREAFRLLERDGLVRVTNGNRTVEVVRYDDDDLRELYEIRGVVDGLAARLLAAKGMTAELETELGGLLADMERYSDPFRSSAYFAAHTAFHLRIAEECGNRRLQPLLSVVRSTSLALHGPMVEPNAEDELGLSQILEFSRTHHQAIFDAIRSGEAPKAEAAARRHIQATLRSDLIHRAAQAQGKK
jgi:GntR family transcriptional regulator, vanillate catabolism transcriptional regulator